MKTLAQAYKSKLESDHRRKAWLGDEGAAPQHSDPVSIPNDDILDVDSGDFEIQENPESNSLPTRAVNVPLSEEDSVEIPDAAQNPLGLAKPSRMAQAILRARKGF